MTETPTKYRATTTAVTIHPEGANFALAEQTLTLQMVDEGAGKFFLLSQDGGTPLRVELVELEMLAWVAGKLLEQPGVVKVEP